MIARDVDAARPRAREAGDRSRLLQRAQDQREDPIGDVVRRLEEALVRTCADYGISTERVAGSRARPPRWS